MNRTPKLHCLAVAVLLLSGASLAVAATADRIISTFDTGTQGSQPNGCGFWYGSGTAGWDGTVDNTPDVPGSGSLYIQTRWGGSDTPCTEYICLPGDNYWWQGAGTYNLSEYKSVQFDIKWDTSSAVTLAQWNDPATFPLGSLGGSIPGIEILAASGAGSSVSLLTTNIPAAAANGWVHITIPVNPAQSGIDPGVGILLKKWLNGSGTLTGLTNEAGVYTNTANFWIDNVILEGTAGPPPPPTVQAPIPAVQGLNIFGSTKGNSFYDRQEVMTLQANGLSWIGNASQASPVEYSFTVVDFPSSPASYGCMAYLFMSPNPGWTPQAPDWNDPSCTIAFMEMGAEGAILHFQYKVDEPDNNMMYATNNNPAANTYTNPPGSWDGVTPNYHETGNIGSVTNPSPLGTWTIRFTSDTNVTLIAPDNEYSSFTIPSYNVAKLGPTTNGFNLFLGYQANNQASLNNAVVYSGFAASGVPSAFTENFLAQSEIDTNIWSWSMSGGPNGILIVPAGSAYWIPWTLPASQFVLEGSSGLASNIPWTGMTGHGPINMVDQRRQLVASSELPAMNQSFFRLVKRVFTKLQILLPGETAAPGTPTGKTGTPLPQAQGVPFDVIVNAVDANWYHIPGITDQITLSSTDPQFGWPSSFNVYMTDGTVTFDTVNLPVYFLSPGDWTVTATDATDGTKTSDTSPSVHVP